VINYDIPNDVEAYVHRVGRTGRAGRTGEAILFASNRERRLLRAIEKSTGKDIEVMQLPTAADVADTRVRRFKDKIGEVLATRPLDAFRTVVEEYQHEYGVPVIEIAAALAVLAQDKQPLFAKEKPARPAPEERPSRRERDFDARERREKPAKKFDKPEGKFHSKPADADESSRESRPERPRRADRDGSSPDKGMVRYRLEVGHQHEVKPGNIVGAIANEAEIDAEYIGRIEIYDDYSTVDMPDGMPMEVFEHLKEVWVSGQKLQISRIGAAAGGAKPKKPRPKPAGKPRAKKRPAVEARKKGKGKPNKPAARD
jgi:ATP-dependent RNA helicase DeaD